MDTPTQRCESPVGASPLPSHPKIAATYITLTREEIAEWGEKLREAEAHINLQGNIIKELQAELKAKKGETIALEIERDEACASAAKLKDGRDALIEAMQRFRHQRNINHYAYLHARECMSRGWKWLFDFIYGKIKQPSNLSPSQLTAAHHALKEEGIRA